MSKSLVTYIVSWRQRKKVIRELRSALCITLSYYLCVPQHESMDWVAYTTNLIDDACYVWIKTCDRLMIKHSFQKRLGNFDLVAS